MKKAIVYGLCALVLCVAASAAWCYQETPTVATSCGGLATGSAYVDGAPWYWNGEDPYVSPVGWGMYDANYSTGDTGPFITLYATYTKPANLLSGTKWNLYHNCSSGTGVSCSAYSETEQLTLPSGCLEGVSVQTKVYYAPLDESTQVMYAYCMNTTGWQLLWQKGYSLSNPAEQVLIEEGMNWSMQPSYYGVRFKVLSHEFSDPQSRFIFRPGMNGTGTLEVTGKNQKFVWRWLISAITKALFS